MGLWDKTKEKAKQARDAARVGVRRARTTATNVHSHLKPAEKAAKRGYEKAKPYAQKAYDYMSQPPESEPKKRRKSRSKKRAAPKAPRYYYPPPPPPRKAKKKKRRRSSSDDDDLSPADYLNGLNPW